ncbi:MAG TPA: SDR family NAD(P)-dependent oxidoreductase [Baekduia sp.]|nr:SDR family NAD(P)-dependent oxidoreductase [Baekduia sp.]
MSSDGNWQAFRLDGRVAVITGAASGIGRATAELYARAGADLALGWYRGDPHDIQGTLDAVEALGARAIAVEGDVARTADVDRLFTAAREAFGKVDIVVANAAIARKVPTADVTDEQWDEIIGIDLGGVFRCFRAALPDMVDQGWGRLLATSSVAGTVQSWPEHAHYAAAKGGVAGMIRSLAVELAPHGITANALAPGVIESPQTLDAANSFGAEGLQQFAPSVPARRNGRPDDVAGAFLYLASEEAAFVTGQVIVIDGGVTLAAL